MDWDSSTKWKRMNKGMKATLFGSITMAAAIAMLLAVPAAYNAIAFPHAHMTIDPEQENANPISVVIGHSDEPAYGVRTAIHNGKHNVEVLLEDAATALPLSGATLKVDKYYFANIDSFNRASSPSNADRVEENATLSEVFGEPGHYVNRQIVREGIYGYRVYGTIDYFGVAEVPIDSTVFCSSAEGDTSKFNSEGWGGGFGCPENINDIRFPLRPVQSSSSSSSVNPTALEEDGRGQQQQYQLLAMGLPVAGLAAFLGIRQWKHKKNDEKE